MNKSKHTLLTNTLPVPIKIIERRIYVIRGQEVMLDSDLAELYQVETRMLNQAVSRNLDRFPKDFIFKLNGQEMQNWKSQIVTSNPAAKMALRKNPYAFTEHGVAMLSSVLHSRRAVQMNIFIIRAFIELRKMLLQQANLTKQLTKIQGVQKLHSQVLSGLVEDVKKLKNPPKTNAIGFKWRK